MKRLGLVLAAMLALAPLNAEAASAELSADANAAFLAANAKKKGVVVTPSGLQYRILQNGYGRRPAPPDTVTVYYSGALINGTVFNSTEPGLPATFQVNKLIQGWTQALTLMREGDHWQLVIPANLAYGTRGAGGGAIPPNQVLVFDLELVSMTPAPPKRPDEDDDN